MAVDAAVRKDSRGAPYLSLKLVDRTGSVDARMWGRLPDDLMEEMPGPAYVDVEGQAHEYRGTLQVKLDRVRVMGREEVAEEDYLPATEQDRRTLAAELEAAGRELQNEDLRQLFDLLGSGAEVWGGVCQ